MVKYTISGLSTVVKSGSRHKKTYITAIKNSIFDTISHQIYSKIPYNMQLRCREGGRTVGSGKVATIIE